jgi:hypothetical protein
MGEWRYGFYFIHILFVSLVRRDLTAAGPVFAHGTTGAKRTVGAPPVNIKIFKTKMRSFAIL